MPPPPRVRTHARQLGACSLAGAVRLPLTHLARSAASASTASLRMPPPPSTSSCAKRSSCSQKSPEVGTSKGSRRLRCGWGHSEGEGRARVRTEAQRGRATGMVAASWQPAHDGLGRLGGLLLALLALLLALALLRGLAFVSLSLQGGA